MIGSTAKRILARKIAINCLVSNIATVVGRIDPLAVKKYILAGAAQYRTLWARDLAMAVQGALSIGEEKAVHDSLDVFFKFQRADGLFPRQIDNRDILTRVALGVIGFPPDFREPLKGWFNTENKVISIDGNLLLPIASSQYVTKTGDREFAKRWFSSAQLAISYLEKNYGVDGLIGNQPPFSDWADSIRRTGRVSFTNALYILALEALANWANLLRQTQVEENFRNRAAQTRDLFFRHFWNEKKKALLNFDGNDQISADANLFAVIYNLVPDENRIQIMETLRNSPLWLPLPGRPTWPNYHHSLKSSLVKWVGVGGYHDAVYWLWIKAMAARAELSIGNRENYDQIMSQLSERIVKDNTIHEIYELSPEKILIPFKRLFYRAEPQFTWSAGMFLEADSIGHQLLHLQNPAA